MQCSLFVFFNPFYSPLQFSCYSFLTYKKMDHLSAGCLFLQFCPSLPAVRLLWIVYVFCLFPYPSLYFLSPPPFSMQLRVTQGELIYNQCGGGELELLISHSALSDILIPLPAKRIRDAIIIDLVRQGLGNLY